ncbi:MAG: hypothetical protein KGJ13_00690 [Patescibacteria group bacterium]|nr:hypothetical protein [Patescibacteria group bacterium]
MNKFKKFAVEFGVPALALLLPVLVSAQITQPPLSAPSNYNNFNQIAGTGSSIICVAINWIFWFLIILTVIFVLIAAFKYLTAAGDPEKVKSASHTLLYAAIAVIVALIAKGFPLIINSFIGGGLGGNIGC